LTDNTKFYNPAAAIVRNSWIWALAGAVIFLFPFIFNLETGGVGFTMNFVGLIIVLSALVSGFIFRKAAKQLDEMVNGKDLLTHWAYSKEEWDRYTEQEHQRDQHDKWLLFKVIAIIAGLVGVVFALLKHDAWFITFLVVGGLILIMAVTARLSIASAYRQNVQHPGDVYIGLTGALLGRKFHYWGLSNAALRSAVIEEGSPLVIKLVYTSPSGKTQGEYIARFPIPLGREAEAKEVLAVLNESIQEIK
jgi:uncharacterized membrane protein YjjP (DUF1212 family)